MAGIHPLIDFLFWPADEGGLEHAVETTDGLFMLDQRRSIEDLVRSDGLRVDDARLSIAELRLLDAIFTADFAVKILEARRVESLVVADDASAVIPGRVYEVSLSEQILIGDVLTKGILILVSDAPLVVDGAVRELALLLPEGVLLSDLGSSELVGGEGATPTSPRRHPYIYVVPSPFRPTPRGRGSH